MLFTSTLLSLFVAQAVVAAPQKLRISGCDVSSAKLVLPKGSTLPAPTLPTSFVSLGLGTQNYTCSDAGTYAAAGALASIFDISCLQGSKYFDRIQDDVATLWNRAPPILTPAKVIALLSGVQSPVVLGEHYFVPNPTGAAGISPKWDFTSHGKFKGNADAYVIGARAGGSPAPTGSKDVDWLALTNVQGGLAEEVYRTDTRGGPPPASCTPGSPPITVKYVSKYWFFGGSVAS